jgi:hypothetical protein
MSLRSKIEPFANRVGNWGTFFTTVSAVMSWIASYVTPLAAYGWGAYVFAGFGAACVISLVLSATLVAWRKFDPLPIRDISSPLILSHPGEAESDSKFEDLKITTINLVKSLDDKLSKLEVSNKTFGEKIDKNAVAEMQRDRSLLALLHWAVDETTLALLDDLVAQAPEDISGDPLLIENLSAPALEERRQYISHVSSRLGPGTHRHSSYLGVVRNAEIDAERGVESISLDKRPADILKFRKHVIAQLQCYRTVQFLRSQKQEKEQEILSQRGQLLELLQERGG